MSTVNEHIEQVTGERRNHLAELRDPLERVYMEIAEGDLPVTLHEWVADNMLFGPPELVEAGRHVQHAAHTLSAAMFMLREAIDKMPTE